MEFEQSFVIPVPVEHAWQVLLDFERIARCMPGAALREAVGDEFKGDVKVKLGPMTVTYSGTARIVERDDASHRAVIEAAGSETRGAGTARATVTSVLHPRGEETEVHVRTALAVTGRPAQFGRSVMHEVADRLLEQFAACLRTEFATDVGTGDGRREAAEARAEEPAAAINLIAVASGPVMRRVAPVLAGLVLVALAIWWLAGR